MPEEPRPQASRQNSQQGPTGSSTEQGPGQQGQGTQGGGAAGLLAGAAQTMITGVLNRLFGQQGGAPPTASNTATPAHSPPHSPPANAQEPEAVQNADRDASLRRAAEAENRPSPATDGPPEWYRNFFAPSPDPPRTPDSPTPMAQVQSGPSRQFPSSDQEIRRTPSFRSRTPTRTPSQRTSSNSRPSTPGTYLYNPDSSSGSGVSSGRPNPLFARPFFQLPPQNTASGTSGATQERRDERQETEDRVERGSSPPPQLEQAARDEQASWAKDRPQRPEDDPPEPLAEELNEYRARQARRERQQRQEEEP